MTTEEHENGDGNARLIEKPTIQETIEDLKSRDSNQVPTTLYYGLSDLDNDSVSEFLLFWDTLDLELKVKILTELAEASEANFELDYQALGNIGLRDSDSEVRIRAIDLLWADESLELLTHLINMAETDESDRVRAAAISELGRFILLGEYGEILEIDASKAQDVAIGILNDMTETVEVRRRALEAISNCSLDFIPEAIREAYESDERLMRVSAVFAMGRSYDEQWSETILREIHSEDPEMRYEAARAAGELEIKEAITFLGQLAVVDEREIRQVAIWSLGEIGGSKAIQLLTALAQDAEDIQDDDLLEAIEDAIGYASLSGADFEFDIDQDRD